MPPGFATARAILLIVAVSYIISAAVLMIMRQRGEEVPAPFIAGWVVGGVMGMVGASFVAPQSPWAWWLSLVSLGPWMALSLVWDVRQGIWLIAALDVAGLAAIGFALWLSRAAVA